MHPGHVFKALLDDRDENPADFAKRVGIEPHRLVLNNKRKFVSTNAFIIASGFQEEPWCSPQHWLRLQDDYDSGRDINLPHRAERYDRASKKIEVEVREKCLEGRAEGRTSEDVGRELGLGKMQVAGVWAADTKGQYS